MNLDIGRILRAGHGNAGLAKEVPRSSSWRLRDHRQHAALITSL